MTDRINDAAQTWNNDGELWNDDNPPSGVRRYLRPLPPEGEVFNPKAPRRSVVRDFDPAFERAEQAEQDLPPRHTYFTGNFASLRAMRVAHQHRVSFWGEDGPLRLFTRSDIPDPNSDQLDQQYEDLQLFSYLPPGLLPTRRQFEDLARPQRRQAATQGRLNRLGVVVDTGSSNGQDQDAADDRLVITTQQPLLPASVPFSGNLADFCTERIRETIS